MTILLHTRFCATFWRCGSDLDRKRSLCSGAYSLMRAHCHSFLDLMSLVVSCGLQWNLEPQLLCKLKKKTQASWVCCSLSTTFLFLKHGLNRLQIYNEIINLNLSSHCHLLLMYYPGGDVALDQLWNGIILFLKGLFTLCKKIKSENSKLREH